MTPLAKAEFSVDRARMPTFLCVGPPRTATSWLHLMLAAQVGLPAGTKETHFFSRYYGRGLSWYQAHFDHCAGAVVLGEICTSYFASPHARARVSHDIRGCKVVCTLREPVERLYSYYKLARRYGWARKRGFEKAFKDELAHPIVSHYALHVKEWSQAVGSRNALVLLYDDLIASPRDYLAALCRFIGVPTPKASPQSFALRINSVDESPRSWRLARMAGKLEFWLASRRRFAALDAFKQSALWRFCTEGGEQFPPLEPELRARLQRSFMPLVEELETLLQRDLSAWKA